MTDSTPATAAVCGPCSVGDHQGCRGCECAYCADLRGTATAAERLIETTIGLWPDDDPPGTRPPRLAAGIVRALHDAGYEIREVAGITSEPARSVRRDR